MAQRQYDIACEVKAYLEKNPAAAVVNLGCGLDETFHKCDNGLCKGYNIDLPDVIGIRNELLTDQKREKNLAFDLNDEAWMDEIVTENGAIFFAAGVFYYFKTEDVKALFCKMAGRSHGKDGYSENRIQRHKLKVSVSNEPAWAKCCDHGHNKQMKKEIGSSDVMSKTIQFEVKTSKHTEMKDITRLVQQAVTDSGVKDGICMVFIPHTTAAVTINENADPDVVRDFTTEIGKIVPWEDGYYHFEGNSAAHLKSSMIGFSEQIIIEDGRLVLGTWQGIYFCEYDGPRSRKVLVKVLDI